MKLTLHHINITGHDVPGLDRFYADVLGQGEVPEMAALPTLDENALRAPVAFRGDGQVQFHLAEQDLELALRHAQAINPLERGHIAFRTDDIAAFKAHLEAKGVPYADYGTTFTRFWHQIFFLDPAGFVMVFHHRGAGDCARALKLAGGWFWPRALALTPPCAWRGQKGRWL
ncbi:MAG: VOC family protein, partial [Pseudomonadota bacterium]